MKKGKWLCLLLAVLLLLPACGGKGQGGGKDQPPAMPSEFEADMTAVIADQTIKAHIIRHALLSCEIRVTEPKMFNGITILWDGDGYRVEYKSLAFDVDLSQFPQSALGAAVVNSIEALARLESLEISEKDGKWHYQGETKSGAFELVQDGETGALLSISVPVCKLEAAFTNFKPIEEK